MSADLTGRINEALDGTTAGPWSSATMLVKRTHTDGFKVIVESPDGWFVVGPADNAEANAAARLIAAAPALLREAAEQLAAKDALVAELRAEIPHMERWEHDGCLRCGEPWPCAGWATS